MVKSKSPKPRKPPAPFPTKAQILAYIRESTTPVGKREIARAFHIRGSERIALKAILKELKEEGLLEPETRRKVAPPGRLPPVLVIEVSEMDEDGELLARPAVWDHDAAPPRIYIVPDKRSRSALAQGDRVLARLTRSPDGSYEARSIRRLDAAPNRVLGIYEIGPEGGRLRPTDKRAKKDFILLPDQSKGAKAGELLLAEVMPSRRGPRLGLRQVRVIERLGAVDNARALSLIAIHEHQIPSEFSPEALASADAAGPVRLGRRADLRALPLVTIDGADARDFDDAVFAEADDDPKNRGGWHLVVAIADVAHYVRPGDALDRAAYERGNSTYFPDRVVPMLPEALSNGWCSLVPAEDRPCLAAQLWIDANGRTRKWRFQRGLMRSAARLTYEQVQEARDGRPDETTRPLMDKLITPLYGAYRALLGERQRRGALDLDLPERRIVLDDQGRVADVVPRVRLDSHRLIEEFMIAANIAAARELERLGQPCMYRVHDTPDPLRLEALAQVLQSFGLKMARGQVIRPKVLNNLLQKVADRPESALISELVLRAQNQALYQPENLGHFGLALTHYAHFTSPIRRYADLLVHRALITGLRLGPDGLPAGAGESFARSGEHISATERRSVAAERDADDRFTAAYLADKVGADFSGRINGVTRFGLFVTLDDTGADGLVPISSLPDDYYDHDEARHCLVGRRWGRRYVLGEGVRVRLQEAVPLTGGLIFSLCAEDGEDVATAAEEAEGPVGWDPLRAQAPEAKQPGKQAKSGRYRRKARAARHKPRSAPAGKKRRR